MIFIKANDNKKIVRINFAWSSLELDKMSKFKLGIGCTVLRFWRNWGWRSCKILIFQKRLIGWLLEHVNGSTLSFQLYRTRHYVTKSIHNAHLKFSMIYWTGPEYYLLKILRLKCFIFLIKMISLSATLILSTIGPRLLIGLSQWIKIVKLILSILIRWPFQVAILLVNLHRIKKRLRVLKGFASFFTLDRKISMLLNWNTCLKRFQML